MNVHRSTCTHGTTHYHLKSCFETGEKNTLLCPLSLYFIENKTKRKKNQKGKTFILKVNTRPSFSGWFFIIIIPDCLKTNPRPWRGSESIDCLFTQWCILFLVSFKSHVSLFVPSTFIMHVSIFVSLYYISFVSISFSLSSFSYVSIFFSYPFIFFVSLSSSSPF